MATRRGQWTGDRVAQSIRQVPIIGEVIQLLPVADALESVRDLVFERCIIAFSVHRQDENGVTDLSWMAYKGRVADNTAIPLEALNPRSASKTTMAHGSIVQIGSLPIPSVNTRFDSAGAEVGNSINREVKVAMVDFDVKRSIQRNTEGIFFTMAASADNVVQVNVLFRTYYTYA